MTLPSIKTDRRLLRRSLKVVLVAACLAAYGLHIWLASDSSRRKRAEEVAAACLKYAFDHNGYLPKRLDDLFPDVAPRGVIFTGLSFEEAIKGYDYLEAGLKLTDPPAAIILRANDPTSDGGRIIVYLGGTGEIQAAR